jgi:hypothetical protein
VTETTFVRDVETVSARRQRDVRYRPSELHGPRVPAIPPPVPVEEPHVWERAGAVRVPAAVATSGVEVTRRPGGEYERAACHCDDLAVCSCDEWWYLPDDPADYRAFEALERCRALIATGARALAAAELADVRATRALARLHATSTRGDDDRSSRRARPEPRANVSRA